MADAIRSSSVIGVQASSPAPSIWDKHLAASGLAHALLDMLDGPAAVVDRQLQSLAANEGARALGTRAPALRLSADGRASFSPQFSAALQLLDDIFAGRKTQALLMQSTDVTLALRLIRMPDLGRCGPTALIVERSLGPDCGTFKIAMQSFGLSPAEARLATALTDGCGLPEAARRLGISHETARVQIKSIFSKTGATSQSGLVRLLCAAIYPAISGRSKVPEGWP